MIFSYKSTLQKMQLNSVHDISATKHLTGFQSRAPHFVVFGVSAHGGGLLCWGELRDSLKGGRPSSLLQEETETRSDHCTTWMMVLSTTAAAEMTQPA